MKKFLCVLFAIILVCVGFSACGTSSSPCYAKVTFSDGSSETLDMKEFNNLRQENSYVYNQKYSGNKIEVVDKITSIWAQSSDASIDTSNWCFFLDEDDPILLDLHKGTLVKINGELAEYVIGHQLILDPTVVIIEEEE